MEKDPEATCLVAVNAPLRNLFTYKSPENIQFKPGQVVKVPFGKNNKETLGLVVRTGSPEKEKQGKNYETKTILEEDEQRPPLTEKTLKWLQWISDYYLYPLGQIQQLVYPPLKKTSRGKSRKSPPVPEVPPKAPPILTEQQQQAVGAIGIGSFKTYLLHGVTGSGKTEVYIQTIAKVLAQGKTALVLVPEISLTPQLIRRFSERFPKQVAVIHSQLTGREKNRPVVEGGGREKTSSHRGQVRFVLSHFQPWTDRNRRRA